MRLYQKQALILTEHRVIEAKEKKKMQETITNGKFQRKTNRSSSFFFLIKDFWSLR